MPSIEEEIKQKKFATQYQKVLVNILFTGSWLHAKHSKLLKRYGLTVEQYNVLRILRGQHPNPCSIQVIVERMIDRSSNASRIVEKLRSKNLVSRAESIKDRRLVDVLITPVGLKLLTELDTALEEFEKVYSQNIENGEAITLNAILDKFRGEHDTDENIELTT